MSIAETLLMVQGESNPRETIGSIIASLFHSSPQPLHFYYPGVHFRVEGTYEEDYRRILAEMQTYDPSLKVRTMGITRWSFYNDEHDSCYRGKDFGGFIFHDIEQIKFDGLLFLPNPFSWGLQIEQAKGADEIPFDYLSRVKPGGILFYQLDRDNRTSPQRLATLRRNLALRSDDMDLEIKEIDSPKHGFSILVIKN